TPDERPLLRQIAPGVVEAQDAHLGRYTLACDGLPEVLFTENESNTERLWGVANRTPFVKDGLNDAVVNGRADKVNPLHAGTKAAAQYKLQLQPGETRSVVLRLSAELPVEPFADAEQVLALRHAEADAFYESQFGAQQMTED